MSVINYTKMSIVIVLAELYNHVIDNIGVIPIIVANKVVLY